MKNANTAERLKSIMKTRHLRQVDILEMAKPYCEKYNVRLGSNDLSQYVTGKVIPGQDKLTILGLALGVTETWLMGYDVPPDREAPVVHNRIKELRLQNKISQQELSSHLGVARSTVAMWESGASQPDHATVIKIADLFNVTTDYLLGRETPVTTPTPWPSIPILGNVAAGTPAEAVENIIGYEEISPTLAATGEFFALRVDGDSMEPRMKKGDIVIVRKQEDVESGDIAVVLVNGDAATIKRIKKRPEGIMLIPSNPSFEPMFYTNEEINTLPVNIIGRVVELHAKL